MLVFFFLNFNYIYIYNILTFIFHTISFTLSISLIHSKMDSNTTPSSRRNKTQSRGSDTPQQESNIGFGQFSQQPPPYFPQFENPNVGFQQPQQPPYRPQFENPNVGFQIPYQFTREGLLAQGYQPANFQLPPLTFPQASTPIINEEKKKKTKISMKLLLRRNNNRKHHNQSPRNNQTQHRRTTERRRGCFQIEPHDKSGVKLRKWR